jgi:hypothetical protein
MHNVLDPEIYTSKQTANNLYALSTNATSCPDTGSSFLFRPTMNCKLVKLQVKQAMEPFGGSPLLQLPAALPRNSEQNTKSLAAICGPTATWRATPGTPYHRCCE